MLFAPFGWIYQPNSPFVLTPYRSQKKVPVPFPFYSCSRVWAYFEITVWNHLHLRIEYHFYSFECSKFLNAYSGCILSPMLLHLCYALGPGSLSLLVFVWCPQLLQNWRYSGRVIDGSQNPAHQAKALGTSISSERSCWFIDMLYWEALAYAGL